MAIPGTVLTAQYDNGGEGVAYHDVDAVNYGSGTYRPGQGVDSNGSGVGWILATEWIAYTVNVGSAGAYTISIPVSHPGTGGTMHVRFNGVNATGSLTVPDTGNWNAYQNITKSVSLSAGTQVMTVAFDTNGSTGYGPGLGDIVITSAGSSQTPFSGTAMAIPGTVAVCEYDNGGEGVAYHDVDAANFQSSTYRPGLGVDADGDHIGWTQPGEWAEYTVNVASAATYTLSIPVANPASGATFHINFDGVNKTGTITVPNTGDWGAYQTITASAALTAGTQVMQIVMDGNSSAGAVMNIKNIAFSAGATQTPFSGVAMAIPGIVKVCEYDNGGAGVAYHDVDAANFQSSTYRPGLGVDADTDHVGWTQPGEWLEYTVNVASAATYTLSIPVANPGSGASFHINFNGVNKTGTITVPNTGDWGVYQTVTATATLTAGTQVMQIAMDANSSGGAVCNLRNIAFSTGSTQTPFSGTPMAIPGTVAVCEYDNGGEGVAYHDNDASNNQSGTYRPGLGVDADADHIGWTFPGEWIEYTVNVGSAATYTLSIPVANPGNGASFHINFDGVNKTGSIAIPNTGNWDVYQTITATATLTAGTQVMQIVMDANSSGGAVCNLKNIAFSSSSTQTPYNGTPAAIPGTVTIGDYDNGGEGVAYHDNDAVNNASSTFRPGSGVDADGTRIGWIQPGEWVEYTVNVASAASYALSMQVANPNAGGAFHVNFDGANKTGTITVPNTGNWDVYQTITATANLSAGRQVMQVYFDTNSPAGAVLNLKDIIFTTGGGNPQTPYSGTPMAIPGNILTAQYDNGGEGIAYHDVDTVNYGSGTYRPGQGVDSSGSGVGWIVASEWLEYTVNVSAAGNYIISIPVSQTAAGATMHVSFGGVNATGPMAIPNTGNWAVSQNITATMNLSAGTQIMQVAFDANASNGYGPGLGDIAITSNQAPTPPTVAVAASASPNPTTTTATLSVLGADDAGESNLTYTWAVIDGAAFPVTFSESGTNAAKNTVATFSGSGFYQIQVTITDASALATTSDVGVTVTGIPKSASIFPPAATVLVSGSQTFDAIFLDQFDAPMTDPTNLSWSVSGGGTIASDGVFVAGPAAGGPFTVTAAANGLSATASVNVVTNPPPTGTAPNIVTAAACQLLAENRMRLTIVANDDGGEVNLDYVWEVVTGPASLAFFDNGTNSAKTTIAELSSAGAYSIRCTVTDADGRSIAGTASANVAQQATTIQISPMTPNVLINGTQQFTAMALDQFDNPLSVQPSFTWIASGRTISTAGLLTAGTTTGNSTITATGGGRSGTTSAQIVTTGAPTIVQAVAAASNPVTTASVALSMLGSDDGGELALTYNWAVISKPYGGSAIFAPNVTNAAKNTVATFNMAGTYRITGAAVDAQNQRCTGTIEVKVQATPSTVRVYPQTASVPPWNGRRFIASAADQFNDPIARFTWSVSGGGRIDADGLFIAGANPGGPFTVTATVSTRSGNASCTVLDPNRSALAVAIMRDTNPERLSPLVLPNAFDESAFNADPNFYLQTMEPGRIWQSASAGPGIPAISSPDPVRQSAASGALVSLRATTVALMPVTFTSLDGGAFPNGFASISVRANSSGIAQITFTTPSRIGVVRVLAASPKSSGQLVYRIAVQ